MDRTAKFDAAARGDGFAEFEATATDTYMLSAISAARAAGWPADEETRECIAAAARMGAELYAELVAKGEDPLVAADRSFAATMTLMTPPADDEGDTAMHGRDEFER